MGDNPMVVGTSFNVFSNRHFSLLGYEPVQKPSTPSLWWLNPDQYLQPAENNPVNSDLAFPTSRSNYNFFNEDLLDVGSDTLVFNTPESQTVIAPISDPRNSICLAVYSERSNDPSFQNLMAQTNGLSLMFNTSDDSFVGFTGGVTNSMIFDNDHFDNYLTPALIWTFKFTN